jgi:GT2 family glycosyltransferase
MSTPPRTVIVVLSYNGLEDTRKCLKSLHAAIRPDVLPLLVDNGSTDGTSDTVAHEFPWCRILRVAVNRGPIVGNNAGIQEALDAGAEWIVLLNNDTTVDPALIDRLMQAAAAHPEFDVLQPVIYFMDNPDVVMTDGCNFNLRGSLGFFDRHVVEVTRSHPPKVAEVDIVNGCCMMIRAAMVRRIGLFDEAYFMYHDESDLCLRVIEAGGRLGVIDHGLIWHKGSATSKMTGKKSIRYLDARNLWYLLRKHSGATRRGRSYLGSFGAYFRYMYFWYCAEHDAGNNASATAVIDGIVDGLLGRRGPYVPGRRLLVRPVRLLFELARRRPRAALRSAGFR